MGHRTIPFARGWAVPSGREQGTIPLLVHGQSLAAAAQRHTVRSDGSTNPLRLVQELGYQFRRKAMGLVQVPQVRLGKCPTRAELAQHLAAAGKQAGEPPFLAAEHLADRPGSPGLAELRQGLLDQRRWQVIQRPGDVGAPQYRKRTSQQPPQYVAAAGSGR